MEHGEEFGEYRECGYWGIFGELGEKWEEYGRTEKVWKEEWGNILVVGVWEGVRKCEGKCGKVCWGVGEM